MFNSLTNSNSLDQKMMQRCMHLAGLGLGKTYPNPMVGCVITHNGLIIGEGWHHKAGDSHAEVMAINSVKNKELLQKSTLFVSLEPCAHFGKTPPCADLIIKHKIPKVVIGTQDSFSEVNGLGIAKLRDNGVTVIVNVLQEKCLILNKRFFTYHNKKRPFITLKWAQTRDGFVDKIKGEIVESNWITNNCSKQLVHKWRTEEQAILVGKNTAINDNPQLNSRLWIGNNPLRIVIDRYLDLPQTLHLFDGSQKTLVLTEKEKQATTNLEYVTLNFNENILNQLMLVLYDKGIQSLIVEGGTNTLQQFIDQNLWDEAKIFTSSTQWRNGLVAPKINGHIISTQQILSDNLTIFQNTDQLF